MMQDEGHTKDEVASIGPYTNYLTLLFVIPIHYLYMQTMMHVTKLKQCNKTVNNKIEQKSMDYNCSKYYTRPLIKYGDTYNIVITMQILQITEWTRARTINGINTIYYIHENWC